MKTANFKLYDVYNVKNDSPTQLCGFLDAYLWDDGKQRPAILVIPGGGYSFLASHECSPVAEKFYSDGFNAFTLKYSVAPNSYPVQLAEACMAMDFIRKNAAEFCVIPDKIACLGFSAGGHLASSVATIGCDEKVRAFVGEDLNCRPDASILVYPVINLDEKIRHVGSAENVSGGNDSLMTYLSTEKRVDKNTPPAFIAHMTTDDTVPVQNSLRYAEALSRSGVNFELHVFPDGWHGMGLGDNPETDEDAVYFERWARWQKLAIEFLKTKHGF